MRYLVDTNGWIGFLQGTSDFGASAKRIMTEESDACFISIASIWEAAIKVALGKLKLPYDLKDDLPHILDENGFTVTGIEIAEGAGVKGLEPLHGDPFDRLQVVQVRERGWAIISRDPVFDRYGLRRIW